MTLDGDHDATASLPPLLAYLVSRLALATERDELDELRLRLGLFIELRVRPNFMPDSPDLYIELLGDDLAAVSLDEHRERSLVTAVVEVGRQRGHSILGTVFAILRCAHPHIAFAEVLGLVVEFGEVLDDDALFTGIATLDYMVFLLDPATGADTTISESLSSYSLSALADRWIASSDERISGRAAALKKGLEAKGLA